MNLHGGEHEKAAPGQTFDLLACIGSAAVAGYCVERIVDAFERNIPEAGVAAVGIGIIALAFTGLAIHEWRIFRGHE